MSEVGLFLQTGHDDGMEFNINSRQSQNVFRGVPNYRPSSRVRRRVFMTGSVEFRSLRTMVSPSFNRLRPTVGLVTHLRPTPIGFNASLALGKHSIRLRWAYTMIVEGCNRRYHLWWRFGMRAGGLKYRMRDTYLRNPWAGNGIESLSSVWLQTECGWYSVTRVQHGAESRRL